MRKYPHTPIFTLSSRFAAIPKKRGLRTGTTRNEREMGKGRREVAQRSKGQKVIGGGKKQEDEKRRNHLCNISYLLPSAES